MVRDGRRMGEEIVGQAKWPNLPEPCRAATPDVPESLNNAGLLAGIGLYDEVVRS